MTKKFPSYLQKIKDLRTARGMSAQQMADELHISDSSYSRIANGDTTLSFEMAMQIAEILDVPINVLAGTDARTITPCIRTAIMSRFARRKRKSGIGVPKSIFWRLLSSC